MSVSDEVGAVVADVGTANARFGFGGDGVPTAIFPSVRESSCVCVLCNMSGVHYYTLFRIPSNALSSTHCEQILLLYIMRVYAGGWV